MENIKIIKTKEKKETYICRFMNRHMIESFYIIGVGPKTEYITIPKVYQKNLNLYGTEPVIEIINLIDKDFKGSLLNFAIDEKSGQKDFFISQKNIENSGFSIPDNQKNGFIRKIETVTLDWFDCHFSKPDNILLWMDIEGWELRALKSGKDLIKSGRCKLINLEVRNKRTHKDACIYNEIHEFMINNNFQFLSAYNYVFNDNGQLHHFDVIYEYIT